MAEPARAALVAFRNSVGAAGGIAKANADAPGDKIIGRAVDVEGGLGETRVTVGVRN